MPVEANRKTKLSHTITTPVLSPKVELSHSESSRTLSLHLKQWHGVSAWEKMQSVRTLSAIALSKIFYFIWNTGETFMLQGRVKISGDLCAEMAATSRPDRSLTERMGKQLVQKIPPGVKARYKGWPERSYWTYSYKWKHTLFE